MTLLELPQRSGKGIRDELLVAAKFRGSRFRDQREGNHTAPFGHFESRDGITNHRRHLLQSSLPAGFDCVSEDHAVRVKTGGYEHRASQL